MWISAALGLACGAGFIPEAIICAAVTMLVLLLSGWVKRIIDRKLPNITVTIKGTTSIISTIIRLSNANNMVIREITSDKPKDGDRTITIHVLFAFKTDEVLLYDPGNSLLSEQDVEKVACNGHEVRSI